MKRPAKKHQFIDRYYALFTLPGTEQEIVRRVDLLVTLSTLGASVIAVFGVLAIIQHNLLLGVMDLIGLMALTINLFLLYRYRHYETSVFAGLLIVSLFFASLYLNGGVEKTTFVWYYVYPAVATFLLGSKKGIIAIIVMTLPIFLTIFLGDKIPAIADYSISFEIRFLGAYGVVGYFAFLFEKIGEENRAAILKANRVLEETVAERTLELEHKNDLLAEKNKQLALDVDQQKQHEQQIALALKEKDVLLKEVYHRTKNNMNVIISLLNLQKRALTPETVEDVFQVIADRIKSMSMVHEQLYQTENVSTIDIGTYIRQLFEHLRYAHLQVNFPVELKLDASRTAIGLELAVPLGLALNEIMTNSLKYAAGTDGPLVLTIKVHCEQNEQIVIDFGDNGPGFPDGFDLATSDSLGTHLIHLLVHDQLDGNISCYSENGAHYHLEIPLNPES